MVSSHVSCEEEEAVEGRQATRKEESSSIPPFHLRRREMLLLSAGSSSENRFCQRRRERCEGDWRAGNRVSSPAVDDSVGSAFQIIRQNTRATELCIVHLAEFPFS